MKKLKAWILGILVILLVICLGLFVFVKHNLPYKGTDTEIIIGDPYSHFNEGNIIPAWKIHFIKPGMTYDEVIHIIGKANDNVGSGLVIYQYNCDNGKKLQLWVCSDVNHGFWIWQTGLEDSDGSFAVIDTDLSVKTQAAKTWFDYYATFSSEPTEAAAG